MNIIVINSILFTPEKEVVPFVQTIKETMIYDLCMAYLRLGHSVTLLAAADFKPAKEEAYDFEVVFLKSIWKRVFKPGLLPFMPGVWSYLRKRRHEVDMVLTSETFSIPSFLSALIVPSKTVVWQELGAHNRKMKMLPSRIWYNVIARCFMRKVWVIPRSYVSQRFISKYMPRVGSPIGHGIVVKQNSISTLKKNQLLTVGRLFWEKNIISVIRKAAAFFSKYPQYNDYVLYVAGDGGLRDEYQEQIRKLGREQQIILLGKLPHEELFRYYRESKASLFDSLRELNMLALMESVAMSTPVVTNRIPFDSEVVEREQLGIARDGWDEDDIARVIEENDRFVANCKRYAQSITVDAVAQRIIDSFEQASKKNI